MSEEKIRVLFDNELVEFKSSCQMGAELALLIKDKEEHTIQLAKEVSNG